MNGTSPAARGNSSTRLETMLRNLSDRVGRMERRQTAPTGARVGRWLLHEVNGDLVAIRDDGECVVLASGEPPKEVRRPGEIENLPNVNLNVEVETTAVVETPLISTHVTTPPITIKVGL